MQIRSFIPPQDFDIMNQVVLEGFDYPENPEWNVRADETENMLENTNSAKRACPIIRVLQVFSSTFRDVMRGFIAEEQSLPAGLINYMRPRNQPEWYIANVTVLPSFRRRGLARKLVQQTLDDLRARKAKTAILEVVDGNLPAIKLYESLGFEIFTDSVEMDLEADSPLLSSNLPAGWTTRPLSRFDWRTGFELANHITPENVTRYQPVIESRFRVPFLRPLLGILFDKIFGSKSLKLVLCNENGKVRGLAQCGYRTRAGGLNHLEIKIESVNHEVAQAFVSHVLGLIRILSPGRRIEVSLEGWQPVLIEAANALGCKKRFGVKRMGLNL